ncbi:MAG: hypothetical protein ABI467_10885 [Kofleriaceae bacterium]
MRLSRVVLVLALASCQRQDAAGSGSGSAAPDCGLVVTRIQQAVQTQIDAVGSDAKVMIAKMMPAMRVACVADHWPASLVQCITASRPGDLTALEQCNALMPKALQDKLQQRMLQLAPLGTRTPSSQGSASPATPIPPARPIPSP